MFIRVSSLPLQHTYVIDDTVRIVCYCVYFSLGSYLFVIVRVCGT